MAFLVDQFFPRARGSGVNQTKAAFYIYDGYIPFNTVIGKFMTCALAIGTGQSLGPEDPSLQIGAGIASALGRRLQLSREKVRLIAPVGAAAGLAAAFNAPISAVLFVIEEVIGKWTAGMLGAVVLSAVSGVVVERWFLGDQPLFRIPEYHLVHLAELVAYAGLGVIGGFASLAFVKLIGYLRPRLRPAALDAILSACGGRLADRGHRPWASAGDGRRLRLDRPGDARAIHVANAGDTGRIQNSCHRLVVYQRNAGRNVCAHAVHRRHDRRRCGHAEHHFVPSGDPVGAYALVGMGTLFAGILRAPMTSVFMVLEVSGNYSIILPVMISNTIAYLISRNTSGPRSSICSRGRTDWTFRRSRKIARLGCCTWKMPCARRWDKSRRRTCLYGNPRNDPGFVRRVPSGRSRWRRLGRYRSGEADGLDPQFRGPAFASCHGNDPYLHPDHPLDTALRVMGESPLSPWCAAVICNAYSA